MPEPVSVEITEDPATWAAAFMALHNRIGRTQPESMADATGVLQVLGELEDMREWAAARVVGESVGGGG